MKILSIIVAFLENMNFNKTAANSDTFVYYWKGSEEVLSYQSNLKILDLKTAQFQSLQ